LYDILILENGQRYIHRAGDGLSPGEKGFTFEESAVALACAHRDINLCVQAKREVGKLWEDIQKPPYTTLFSEKTNAMRMWHAVEIMRAVDAELIRAVSARQGEARQIAKHANRFILHMVFQSGLDPDGDLNANRQKVPAVVEVILDSLIRAITAPNEPSCYAGSLFKNASKCRALADQIGTVRAESTKREMEPHKEDQGRLFQQ
jgi:hypothetical protein